MTEQKINGRQLASMFEEGAALLAQNVKQVDALNVFPVPDGDTGTNMNLTMTSGVKEITEKPDDHAGKTAKTFSKGLLMGARGNSGVILSQLFRGFSKAVEKKEELSVEDLTGAFEEGVATAYKAVMKPVEGTILTVAKDAAELGSSTQESNAADWLKKVLNEAEASLQRTPDLLPVLKEVGVVDSGGQGLVYIYEGMLLALQGKKSDKSKSAPSLNDLVKVEHHQNAQSHLATEDITYGYCTEVMVKFEEDKIKRRPYEESVFKNELAACGDSLLVVSDEDLLKIHIHAEYPGEVLTSAQKFGSIVHVKIENMREQHQALLSEEQSSKAQDPVQEPAESNNKEFGFVTISMGDGVEALFKGLGVNEVISGGQTMNPSTEDIISAINKVQARHIFVLPNNSNIIMTAEQAAEVSGGHVQVIHTKTVPQGLGAMFAFSEETSAEENKQAMEQAGKSVKTGQVTYAVRDTVIDGLEIKEGDFMGLAEKKIIASSSDLEEVSKKLIDSLLDDDSEIVTFIYGEGADLQLAEKLASYAEKQFPDLEVEYHDGGQPLYSFIISVE
ncbi:DAK2 domain-containing protein [Alteribacillus sp. HJP-4]|uniref:DAK2 domain-containing protein n=1 Tax=Alteribacillus sp. HJP-4 TaxID=2775394 RepID=UPI0035CCFED1